MQPSVSLPLESTSLQSEANSALVSQLVPTDCRSVPAAALGSPSCSERKRCLIPPTSPVLSATIQIFIFLFFKVMKFNSSSTLFHPSAEERTFLEKGFADPSVNSNAHLSSRCKEQQCKHAEKVSRSSSSSIFHQILMSY